MQKKDKRREEICGQKKKAGAIFFVFEKKTKFMFSSFIIIYDFSQKIMVKKGKSKKTKVKNEKWCS